VKPLGFTRGAVGELGVRMHTRAGRIAPGSLAVFPCRNDPAVPGRIATSHEWIAKYLVVVTHRIELRSALEHHAVLHDQTAKSLVGFIGKPELHSNGVTGWNNRCFKGHLIRQSAFDSQRAVLANPFERLQCDPLPSPHRWDVGMRQIQKLPVFPSLHPDRLR
jgi:hypothetical protein